VSYRNALCGLLLALLVAWPTAGAFAQAPLTRLYLQESASREVEQNVVVATVVERVRADPEIRAATGSYSVYQRYDRDNRPVGWVAEQDLRLTSKDPAALLELTGSLQETGLNLVGLGWQVDDETRRKVQDELTIAAIATLRQRAEAIAGSVDMQVANIDTLRVGGAMEGPRPMMMRAEAMTDAPPPTALPDLETIQSHVEAEIVLSPR
jgi:predicted secreted protein